MFAAKKSEPAIQPTGNDLVSVTLKALIDLAKSISGLTTHRLTIRSQQSGGYLSSFKGRGMEFDETRLYQSGDDIRSIDWRVTARTGKTYTKLFREEREKPVFISVDDRLAMHFATRGVYKAVQAKKIAALLAWIANQQGDKIGGQVFSATACREVKPQNGKHAVLHFLNTLVLDQAKVVQATGQTDEAQKTPADHSNLSLAQVLARLSQHTRPGSSIYIISDFRGINGQAENYLIKLSDHCDVILILVFDPLEKNLPSQGRYRFANGSKEVVIDTADKKQLVKYHAHFEERVRTLTRVSQRRGLAFIQCSTQDDVVQFLRKSRGKK